VFLVFNNLLSTLHFVVNNGYYYKLSCQPPTSLERFPAGLLYDVSFTHAHTYAQNTEACIVHNLWSHTWVNHDEFCSDRQIPTLYNRGIELSKCFYPVRLR